MPSRFKRLCVLIALTLIVPLSPLTAITLDSFEEADSISLPSGAAAGAAKTAHFSAAGTIGGGHTLTLSKTSSGAGSNALEIFDSTILFNLGSHSGSGMIVWDGDSDASTINPHGLGGIDLTEDGSSAFLLRVVSFDLAFGQPVDLVLRAYEFGNADYSQVTVRLDQAWPPLNKSGEELLIPVPFSLFQSAGISLIQASHGITVQATAVIGPSGQPANISSIGALSLIFRGYSSDLTLKALMTNGNCDAAPSVASSVFDECGVCRSDPHAGAGADRCGVCLFGSPGYSYQDHKAFDECGQCPGEIGYNFPSGARDSCGICLNGPPPYTYSDVRDACGECGGSAVSVSQCCTVVAPTSQIRDFENRLLEKAALLRKRFLSDVDRWNRHACPGSPRGAVRRVSKAFSVIAVEGKSIFQRGISVCGDSCVTVSFAARVSALQPQFAILEQETIATALKVKQCYAQKRVIRAPGTSSSASKTIQDVRQGLQTLIKECRRSRVCKEH